MKTKTLQKIVVLALIALALVWTYNEINPPISKSKVVPSGDSDLASGVTAAATIVVAKAVVESAAKMETPKLPILEKPEPAPLINLDKLPPGEFVIVNRVSQITDAGVKSFFMGERVREVGEGLYSNGKITLPVPSDKLTNSRSIADGLAEALARERAKVPPLPSAAPPLITNAPNLNPVPSGVPNNPNEAWNKGIDRQVEMLNKKIRDLENKATSQINANGPVVTRLRIQIEKLEAQRR